MTNIIFSGIDKTFFNNLTFNKQVTANWLAIDELINTTPEVNNSNVKYVVFYSSPEAYLSSLNSYTVNNMAQAEEQWLPQTELLSQFYLAHKANALLIDSEQCGLKVDAFTALVDTKFNVDSQITMATANSEKVNNNADKLLTQSLKLTIVTALNENYDIQSTYENVISAADLLIISDDYTPEDRASTLRDNCQALVNNINNQYSKYATLVKENASTLTQVQQLQEELKAACQQHKTSEEQLKHHLKQNKEASNIAKKELSAVKENNNQLAQEKTKLESSVNSLESENELSLSLVHEQIQQLQEELEATFIQKKSSEEKLKLKLKLSNELNTKTNNELTAENELSLLQIQQLQEELETIYNQHKISKEQLALNKDASHKASNDISILESSISELTSENELSLLQVQQLQEELESTFIQMKTSEEKLNLSAELANNTKKDLASANSNNIQLAKDKTKLESNISELTAENELSLLQVQQLQEEFETTYNQYKVSEEQLNHELKQKLQLSKDASRKNIDELSKAAENNNKQVSELQIENEIALLQIQQLQEELEFYFIKFQSLSSNSFISNVTPINITDKRFEKSLNLAKLLKA